MFFLSLPNLVVVLRASQPASMIDVLECSLDDDVVVLGSWEEWKNEEDGGSDSVSISFEPPYVIIWSETRYHCRPIDGLLSD